MRWLVKEEPSNYNFDQFLADGSTVWSGVKNPLAQRILKGEFGPGSKVKVTAKGGQLVFGKAG